MTVTFPWRKRLSRHFALHYSTARAIMCRMRNEFTAIIEKDDDWFIAYSPEVPGANGQGRSKEEARQSLAQAIQLILKDRRTDGLRGLPPDAGRRH